MSTTAGLFCGMLFLILVWALTAVPREERLSDRRLTFTWGDVWYALGMWAGLVAIVLGAFIALDWSIYGLPRWP